jgi:membrane-associated protease RseP (regulator of RpoE activity)
MMDRLASTRHERAISRLAERGAVVNAPSDDERAIFPGGIVVRGAVVAIDSFDDYSSASGRTTIHIGKEWKAGRKGLALLGRLTSVVQLSLEGPEVTDEWLADIAAMDRLKPMTLMLRGTNITDEGVKSVVKITSLAQLAIYHSPSVTDEGARQIESLASLNHVQLYGTKITPAGAEALARALPNARIDRRHGALLGVRCEVADDEVCTVSGVQANSAAEKAGILADDIIVGFDGKPVKGFASLTALISEKSGGDKVEVEVRRNDQKVVTTVILGSW